MKIISWNIRWLASSVKKRFVSKHIRDRSPNVLLLHETKIERFEMYVVQKMWGSSDVAYAESGSVGLSGGLLTVWNPDNGCVGMIQRLMAKIGSWMILWTWLRPEWRYG